MPFWVKTVLLGQEVHYYMVYIAYFTELNSKIWDYAQKRRICRENCKYALDERFHGHFCPRRKPAKSCHPANINNITFITNINNNTLYYSILPLLPLLPPINLQIEILWMSKLPILPKFLIIGVFFLMELNGPYRFLHFFTLLPKFLYHC